MCSNALSRGDPSCTGRCRSCRGALRHRMRPRPPADRARGDLEHPSPPRCRRTAGGPNEVRSRRRLRYQAARRRDRRRSRRRCPPPAAPVFLSRRVRRCRGVRMHPSCSSGQGRCSASARMSARPDGERNSANFSAGGRAIILSQPGQHVEHETAEEVQAKLNRHRHEQSDDLAPSFTCTIGDGQPFCDFITVRCVGVEDVPVERASRTNRQLDHQAPRWLLGTVPARRAAPSRDLCPGIHGTQRRVRRFPRGTRGATVPGRLQRRCGCRPGLRRSRGHRPPVHRQAAPSWCRASSVVA